MGHAISPGDVHEYVSAIYGEALHAKRVLSMSNAVTGVIPLRRGGDSRDWGFGLAIARGQFSTKHPVKQVDRLLSNDAINVPSLLKNWIPQVVGERSEIWVGTRLGPSSPLTTT